MPQTETTQQFADVNKLSKITGIPAYTIRKLLREEKLPAYRITGKKYLFDIEEVN